MRRVFQYPCRRFDLSVLREVTMKKIERNEQTGKIEISDQRYVFDLDEDEELKIVRLNKNKKQA